MRAHRGSSSLRRPQAAPLSPSASHGSDDDSVDERSSSSASSSAEDFRQRLLAPATARKDGSVRVAVRVRPLLPKEIARNAGACVERIGDHDSSVQLTPAAGSTPKRFTFDHVFPLSATQADLYEEALQPWMTSFLQGFNVTVIAYGQTGSGKTYTMGNNMPSSSVMASHLFSQSRTTAIASEEAMEDTLRDDEGLIPRFLHQLFARLDEAGGDHQLSVSFLEIYGEEIHDLLNNAKAERGADRPENLQLREGKAGIWVQGLTEIKVGSRQQAMEQMQLGSLRRITGSTEMNDRSSRSHAVYTVKIVQRIGQRDAKESAAGAGAATNGGSNGSIPNGGRRGAVPNGEIDSSKRSEEEATIVSTLTFVDLAGSERLKKTLAEGHRMKEGIQINVGLLALGNVINALGDERHRAASQLHVPYRSSKLTRLLQDALGGNSRTLFMQVTLLLATLWEGSETNASETLSTLQYANRAKNIQNKAVKNIDSRSAELLSLKAFNQLLRRELIKAIFAGSGGMDLVNADNLADATMANPKVLAYLNKMEQLAASTGVGSRDEERSMETRRLLDGLTAQLFDIVPGNGYRRVVSSSRPNTVEGESVERHDETDSVSDSGSSVTIMEVEEKENECSAVVARYPLNQLCRTLDIISLTLEAQEVQNLEARHRKSIESKINDVDTRLHRKELVRDALAETVEKMRMWLASAACDPAAEKCRTLQKHVERGAEKLELMEIEIEELQRQKFEMEDELKMQVKRCRKELKAKHDRIGQVRQSREQAIDGTTSSPLDILIRASEIKHRFKLWDLVGISNCLEGKEVEMAAYLDEDVEAIAYMSSLFTKEEMSSSISLDIFTKIKEQLQVALDNEDLNASMSRELRSRAQLLQSIMEGWISCHRGDLTEQQFMEANELKLKSCEESIAQIDAAIRSKRKQQGSMAAVLDSISSLEMAKNVMKRLIEEMYSQKRIYLAFFEEDDLKEDKTDPEMLASSSNGSLAIDAAMHAKRIEELTENYEKDVLCALQMVASFKTNVEAGDSRLTQAQLSLWTDKYAAADEKVATLEESEKALVTQLAEKDEEMAKMRAQLDQLQASAKNSEMKEESFHLMNRCQEIWRELGLDEDDQARKFQDINELLIKKCSEELEGLEAAREKLQARIDGAYHAVKQMEVVLKVTDPIDMEKLSAVAGPTLLEQEKYLLTLRRRLVEKLRQRLNARFRSLDGIRELVDGLKIESIEDFRHVPHDEVGTLDLLSLRRTFAQLDQLRAYHLNPDSQSLLEQLLESFDSSSVISFSNEGTQQDELLLNALLKEKTKRIAEVEDLLSAIRSATREMQFSQEEIVSALEAMRKADPGLDPDVEIRAEDANRFEDLAAWILEKGGKLDVSEQGLKALTAVRRCFGEIHAGRLNALAFLKGALEEAVELAQDVLAYPDVESVNLGPSPNQEQHETSGEGHECSRAALVAGRKRLETLSEPLEGSLRAVLYSMNGEFAAFGIETDEQRVSFFLGGNDADQATRREVLEKYAVFGASSDEEEERSEEIEQLQDCHDSFLSHLDPAFEELHVTYSESYGQQQLQRVRKAIADVAVVKMTVQSAQNRMQSLTKIMKQYNEITEFKKKIAEFEANASQKDRLFGNSMRLLEEERFRKMAAKRYPNLLASLRKEVARWQQNEDGEYDLSVLGEDLKNLLQDMMSTDTELMHLDLGVLDHSRPTVRRPVKPYLTPNLSVANPQAASSDPQRASAPARARTQSMTSRTRTPTARRLTLDQD